MIDDILYVINMIKMRLRDVGVTCAMDSADNKKLLRLAWELRQLVCALGESPGDTLYENARIVAWSTTGRWNYVNSLPDVLASMRYVQAYLRAYGQGVAPCL